MIEARDIPGLVLPHGFWGWTSMVSFAVAVWFGWGKRDTDSAHQWLAIAWFAAGVAAVWAVIDSLVILGNRPAIVVFTNAAVRGIATMLPPAVITLVLLPLIHLRRHRTHSTTPLAVRFLFQVSLWLTAIDFLLVVICLLFFANAFPIDVPFYRHPAVDL